MLVKRTNPYIISGNTHQKQNKKVLTNNKWSTHEWKTRNIVVHIVVCVYTCFLCVSVYWCERKRVCVCMHKIICVLCVKWIVSFINNTCVHTWTYLYTRIAKEEKKINKKVRCSLVYYELNNSNTTITSQLTTLLISFLLLYTLFGVCMLNEEKTFFVRVTQVSISI